MAAQPDVRLAPPYLYPDTPTPTATTKKIFTHTLLALSPLLPLTASHPNHPFTHPGILVSSDRLHSIKHHVSANHEPWASAYDSMLSHPFGSTTRKPSPVATVVCGPTSTPNIGCYDERNDALAAYGMSLAWAISGIQTYADKAIEYMNAWSAVLKAHEHSNAPLQVGWAGAVWPRAAEIIRYTRAGWEDGDVEAFEKMLREVYLEQSLAGSSVNGNWDLVMLESALSISIFLSNTTSYHRALDAFRTRIPAYIYLTTDGALPRTAPRDNLTTPDEIIKYWNGLDSFRANGLAQETCRDLNHTGYGLSSISHVAQTVAIQGGDLLSETDAGGGSVEERLASSYELHAGWLNRPESVPEWACGGVLDWDLGATTEVGYDLLVRRGGKGRRGRRRGKGRKMPETWKWTLGQRPAELGTNLPLFFAWETLTHGGQEWH